MTPQKRRGQRQTWTLGNFLATGCVYRLEEWNTEWKLQYGWRSFRGSNYRKLLHSLLSTSKFALPPNRQKIHEAMPTETSGYHVACRIKSILYYNRYYNILKYTTITYYDILQYTIIYYRYTIKAELPGASHYCQARLRHSAGLGLAPSLSLGFKMAAYFSGLTGRLQS